MTRWNWNPSAIAYMDIETQSAANLRKVGGKAYLRDKTTRLLSAVWRVASRNIVWIPDGRAPYTYCPDSTPDTTYYLCRDIPDEIRALARTHTWVAHNAETFDAIAWGIFYPDCQPEWCDTLHFCRLAGYPGGLDAASKAMGGAGKADSTAMRLLTDAKVTARGLQYPVGTPALWDKLIQYNIADVLELERNAETVLHPTPETAVMACNSEINSRGMHIDLRLARQLKDCWVQCQKESTDTIAEITKGALNAENIRSVPQVKKYLASRGFQVASLNAATINQILNGDGDYVYDGDTEEWQDVLRLLAERQNATRATVGKLDRVFSVVDDDGAIRNVIQYHGAGTGRFSGRDLQPHNFARGFKIGALPALLNDCTYEAVRAAASATRHPQLDRTLQPAEVLATLTRSVIRARPGCKLIPVDYASIEARGIAWIARCDRALQVFASGADIYCDMASSLFGRPVTKKDEALRQTGKIIVLGCNYGMGAAKFGVTCQVQLADLDAVGVTPEQCVKAYRDAYPEIRQVWYELDRAMHYVVRNPGSTAIAGRCMLGYESGFAFIELPSGRRLRYREARIVMRPPKWNPTGAPVPQIVYRSAFGFEKTIYGGLIAENIVQAISRDILCSALLRSPVPVVLHVHDEIVGESPARDAGASLRRLAACMVDTPHWAKGFPLAAEGYTGEWYTKTPLPGEEKYEISAQV